MSQPQTPQPTGALPTFRLPSQPTIVLKAPSDETITRFRQLAPYYWKHPETTNCSVHFPIDIRTQQRVARQRQQQHQAQRARGGSVAHDPTASRRPSFTPAPPPSSMPGRSGSIAKQGSMTRLRAVYSGRDLAGSAARAAILGSDSSLPTSPSATGDGSWPRRGSLTPSYDPFSAGRNSVVSSPAPDAKSGAAPNMGRRGSVAVIGANGAPVQMRSVRLHVEYLTAQSSLIRQVLAQATGYQAIPDTPLPGLLTPAPTPGGKQQSGFPAPPSHIPSNPFPHSFFRFSPHRYPRVIPGPSSSTAPAPVAPSTDAPPMPTHIGPTIILPVPDPNSFPVLIHYMYHGRTEALEDALRSGSATWEGLVRNVEYLGLREDVKRYLGKWWKSWRESNGRAATAEEEEDEAVAGYHYPAGMDMEDDAQSWTSSGTSVTSASSQLDDEMAGLLGKF